MTIEIHNPQGLLHSWEVDYLKDKLLELHKRDTEISRAEVYFREDQIALGHKYVCEIDITIYGDSFLMKSSAKSYLQAARETLKHIECKVDELVSKRNIPPDEVTSTIDI
ncbi:hypothetical protein LK994_09440 [Ferruginibacter lapsinanis]|uniref:hypothetical protein n=1 Tax=Ferruginibacter lapsinanis TaxID=563172 RepID=UPI001E5CFBE0|nr:hypothetical protein [Ferruginibacter lapsinanis]UEG48859.1 hypothetical protein LK994_09440 [Ferruginibacter lapsinanis]